MHESLETWLTIHCRVCKGCKQVAGFEAWGTGLLSSWSVLQAVLAAFAWGLKQTLPVAVQRVQAEAPALLKLLPVQSRHTLPVAE